MDVSKKIQQTKDKLQSYFGLRDWEHAGFAGEILFQANGYNPQLAKAITVLGYSSKENGNPVNISTNLNELSIKVKDMDILIQEIDAAAEKMQQEHENKKTPRSI